MQAARVGLFGGSFDPPTIAHSFAARWALEKLELDQVWWIPARLNPLKQDRRVSPVERRLELVESIVARDETFRVETCELERDGLSYTVDTLTYLQSRHPDIHFILLLGSDTVQEFHRWHRIDEIFSLVDVVVLKRAGYEPGIDESDWRDRIRLLEFPCMDISSTMVRERCAAGRPVHDLVPGDVNRLIQRHGLYR
ncbi:nicotinate (nicotinamide) nucleotide adenylyltransferase [bacterium]|nr:nicotinate (nicotinamide) nucleotide adenylyltransferase [bacterium]